MPVFVSKFPYPLYYLLFLPWLKTILSLGIFIFPGTTLSIFLLRERLSLATHIASGFSLSIFLIGCIGLLGRIFHFSFASVQLLFFLVGIIITIFLVIHKYRHPKTPLYRREVVCWRVVGVLLFVFICFAVITLSGRFSGDDQSYLAYLTTWQHSSSLNFSEVYFGSNAIDSKRFWLAVFPMSLALIANLSGIHGMLLLGLYIEPILVGLSLITIYLFYKEFLNSKKLSLSALLMHALFLLLLLGRQQSGQLFVYRLSEDKVVAAFILTPVFLLAIRHWVQCPSIKTALFLVFSGWSLVFTHPVILAFAVFIGTGYTIIFLLWHRRNYRVLLLSAALLAFILVPGLLLRFVNDGVSQIAYDSDAALNQDRHITDSRIAVIPGTPFYGFNPERVKLITAATTLLNDNYSYKPFAWLYIWVLVLTFIWSFIRGRNDEVALLLFVSSLLVLLGLIPYTGWLLGYFVAARMLWRIPWIYPIGLAALFLLRDFFNFIDRRAATNNNCRKLSTEGILFWLALVLFASFAARLSYSAKWHVLTQQRKYARSLERLVDLGKHLDTEFDKPARFITPKKLSKPIYGLSEQNMMNYLPGLSANAKVIDFRYFRSSPFFESSLYANHEETDLLFTIDGTVSYKDKQKIMQKYSIDAILADDPELQDYFAQKPELFSVEEVAGFWIIKVK